jgi:phosphoribosylformylglycinamidine synthase
MSDFAAVVRGIGDACRAFGVPVTGGNVSFYNESPQGTVHPTPIVGMLGVLDNAYAFRPPAASEGDTIVLLGHTHPELGGSEALAVAHDTVAGRAPRIDLGAEVALARLLATPGLGSAAHDLSEGGLAVALAEMCIRSRCGAQITLPAGEWWELFSESTARALLTFSPEALDRVLEAASRLGVPAQRIGEFRGEDLEIAGVLRLSLDELRRPYEGTIPALMDR